MTIREQIIQYLKAHPEGIDDDRLSEALGLKARQQANIRCRKLADEGLVIRRSVHGKIHNFWANVDPISIEQPSIPRTPSALSSWFWEGNVQATVVNYLVSHNYLIRSVADTASRQTGKDIIAERKGKPLWITVKGYPKGTEKTSPSTQAGHWFKQAIFDVIAYRGESASIELGVALPDYPRYRSLAAKIKWFQPVARFTYFWVQKDGFVQLEQLESIDH